MIFRTFATLQKHNFERKQAELQSISEKIRVLYGPLHGNRVGQIRIVSFFRQ